MKNDNYAGLDLLTTAVIVLNQELAVVFINTAGEDLFAVSRNSVLGQPLNIILTDVERLMDDCQQALSKKMGFIEHEWAFHTSSHSKEILSCTGTPTDDNPPRILLEFRPISQRVKIAKEEKIIQDQEINRQLMRNLAHEIRNPLGGIKGAAQLLEKELKHPDLKEYTDVIKNESDRLQQLLDRMLSPNSRMHHPDPLNIHEVLERVRSVTLAEFPQMRIVRDYDTSIPEFLADREQLIQAVLNIVRNGAQAMQGQGIIRLQTRILRQITLAKKRFKLGVLIKIIDNGPGIPIELQPRIFQPLVSGREGGTGLGLMLAQNLISQHYGMVEFESRPGLTSFSLILPMTETEFT